MRKTFLTTSFRPTSLKKSINDLLIAFFKEWSWTIAWSLFCAISLEVALKARENEYKELQQERISLESQLKEAAKLNEKYLHEMNSQSDPAWIELVLMRKLGLVPEGQTKIVFKSKDH